MDRRQKMGEETAKLLLAMAENFNQELSEARLGLILEALQPYCLDEIEAGVKKILRSSRFFPTLAELLDAIEGSPRDTLALGAEKQWAALLTAANKGAFHPQGLAKASDYMDQAALAVFRNMGGSDSFNTWTNQDLHWRKKEFCQAYELLANNPEKLTEITQMQYGQLPGKLGSLIRGIGAGKGSLGQGPKLPGAA